MAAIAAAFAAGARADSSTPRLLANARRKAAQYSAAAGGAEAAAAGSGATGSGLDACDRVDAATDPMIVPPTSAATTRRPANPTSRMVDMSV